MSRRRFVTAATAALLASLFAATPAAAAPRKRRAASARKPPTGSPKRARNDARATPAQPAAVSEPEPREATAPPWRQYEIVTTVALPETPGPARIWLPLPLSSDPSWQRTIEHQWSGNFDRAGIYADPDGDAQALYAEWSDGIRAPRIELTGWVAVRERQFDVTRRGAHAEPADVLRRNLRSTPRLPTDGLVRATAERIVGRIKDPVAQGKAIYDWVAERTRFDPVGTGTGNGDVMAMIERPESGGRCADINGLFVALARAIGLPARLTFGQRIDQSLIVASLGQRGELASAQHCRAEFYAPGYGWIPVDPADVRKALAEDSSTLDGMKGTVLRKLLFGFWEPNWVALNRARDVALRHASGPPLVAFVRPYAEVAGKASVAAPGGTQIGIRATRRQDAPA